MVRCLIPVPSVIDYNSDTHSCLMGNPRLMVTSTLPSKHGDDPKGSRFGDYLTVAVLPAKMR